MACQGPPFLSLPLCQKEAVHFHLNGRSTCQGVEVKTHRTQRKNIVENDGGRPLFMFQWTTCSLHRPNPGAILQLIHHHPPHQRHSAPFPLCTNPFIFLGKYMYLLRSPAHFHSLQRTVLKFWLGVHHFEINSGFYIKLMNSGCFVYFN